jgi:hypothetical protein
MRGTIMAPNLMLDRLLPPLIDNSYGGPKPALWLLGFLAAIKAVMSLNSIFNGYAVLTSADGVPLPSYPAEAAQTIVTVFALWAVGQLLFALLAILALVRYRSMTSLLFGLFLIEHLGRKVVLQFLPITRSGAAPASVINLVLLAVMAGGLLLSLRRPVDAAHAT